MAKTPAPVTPDGRYLVVRGRLWRRADPGLPADERDSLVAALMNARRGVRDAPRSGDGDELRLARLAVDDAKRGLGERGPVWWADGAPDQNRRMARNSSYALWWRAIEEEDRMTPPGGYRVERLAYNDELLEIIDLPRAPLRVTRGLGSGLTRRTGDPPGRVWAVGDRGPNLKVKLLEKRYGATGLQILRGRDGVKIMPALHHGPALTELEVAGDHVRILRTLPLRDGAGTPLSPLPLPCSLEAEDEPMFAPDGTPLGTSPAGVDSEGIAACADGGFWIGDEYGPSLLRVDAEGRVLFRWVPAGSAVDTAGAGFPVLPALPALAGARRLNRGFEAIALSPDERWLFLAFQSPLAHPDRDAHAGSRNVRLWQLDAATGALQAEYLYRQEPAARFGRDVANGPFEQADVKLSEMLVLGHSGADTSLLILERGSASIKFFRVDLTPALALPAALRDPATRPTLEQMDDAALAAAGVVALPKTPVLDTDDAPALPADLEGAVMLSPTELLLVNDNDFGVEGAATEFWRVTFDAPL